MCVGCCQDSDIWKAADTLARLTEDYYANSIPESADERMEAQMRYILLTSNRNHRAIETKLATLHDDDDDDDDDDTNSPPLPQSAMDFFYSSRRPALICKVEFRAIGALLHCFSVLCFHLLTLLRAPGDERN